MAPPPPPLRHPHHPPLPSHSPPHERSHAPVSDIILLVGKRRQPYHVNTQSLMRGSAYFRRLLDRASPSGAWPPLALDCDEVIFENLLLLMRYGTLEALPPMSAAETFQLKKEASFYGIEYTEPQGDVGRPAMRSDTSSEVSSGSAPQSPASSSPKSVMISPRRRLVKRDVDRHHDLVHVACSTPQGGLSELPEFPLDLADPGKLVVVTHASAENGRVYCCECGGSGNGTTEWGLNFHHRHAFCTACGEAPKMSAKHFADMFMGAAALYVAEQGARTAASAAGKWRIRCDSTCLLRFVSSGGNGADMCGCQGAEAAGRTVWAASSFYSHAFCTCCGEGASGPVLLSVLLALRFGASGRGGCRSARFGFAAQHQ